MTPEQLAAAIQEAERFLKAAYQLQLRPVTYGTHDESPSQLTAATRRASLDLTRALAQLRRRGQ